MLEETILSNLIFNEAFTRKAIPHLKSEYFGSPKTQSIFDIINYFFLKYNTLPTKESLLIELAQKENLSQETFEECEKTINAFEKQDDVALDWLIDQAEKFCQEKAVFNAIMESIQIIEGKNKKKNSSSIPALLTAALGVSFDIKLGHDYFEDAEQRFEYYHTEENKIKLGMPLIDLVTNNGIPKKTLNGILAGINVGKTAILCDFAARYRKQGKNVLYFTLEVAEEKIAERIDQNLLDITNEELHRLNKKEFLGKIEEVKNQSLGRIEIKEYPTSTASAANFRYFIDELIIKKNFKPDVIIFDYVNICASARFKAGANVNSYTYVKAIAEELRGLCVEYDVIGWTGTQLTRDGLNASDLDMSDVSESIGLPATLDLMFAVITNEELEKKKHLLWKQIKNRFRNKAKNRRFVVGFEVEKQMLFHVDERDQVEYSDNPTIAPKSEETTVEPVMATKESKFDKDKFRIFE